MKKILVSTFVAAAAFVAMAGPASAHHPEVQATVRCENGAWTITATVEAWQTDDAARRHNNGISLQVVQRNRALVAAGGKLTADNGFRFTESFTSLAPGHYIVRAISVRPWGPNEEFGSELESREVLVVAEGPCGGEVSQRPLPTIAPKPTVVEVVATPEIGTPQVVERAPVHVAGEQLEAPTVPQPHVLAFTGAGTGALSVAAAVLIFAGSFAVLTGKRKGGAA